jgi:hypothetical protein
LRLLLLISVVAVIPLGTFSISSIGARHLFIIVPLAWLLVALTIADCMRLLATRIANRMALALAILLVAVLPVNAAATNALIQRYMAASGGQALWSDAIYTLASDLTTKYPGRPVMALDWGFERNITFLTQGQVRMREMYEYLPEPSARFADVSTVMLRDPSNVYLFHAPDVTAFPGYLETMQRAAAQMHKQIMLQEEIDERSGAANTFIYTAADMPRSFVVSPTLATRNAVFSGGITLLGGTASYTSSRHEVAVQLYWQNHADHQTDDTVLVHVIDQADGKAIVIADQQPLYGSYPFSKWQNGEVVVDQRWIDIPPDLKPGTYQVRIGIYDTHTGVRRAIEDPMHNAAGDSLMLHYFEIK